MRGFGGGDDGFCLQQILLRRFHHGGEHVEIAEPGGLLRQRVNLALDIADFLFEP